MNLKFLFHHREHAPKTTFDYALRLVRSVIGFTVLAVGVVLLFLPGPAIIVIPVGLAILATEYAWARRYLSRFKRQGERLGAIFFKRRKRDDNENKKAAS